MGVSPVVHLPGLNGIRAIAAVAVVISHTTLALKDFGLDPYIFGSTPEGTPGGTDLAAFGVSMFFALSGFLITYLLLLEKDKQSIDVRNFYIRRILRIHPLYFFYIVLSIGLMVAFQIEFSHGSLWFYILMLPNVPFVLGTAPYLLAHYWSLGVEEQFYAFYPWLVKKAERLPTVLIVLTTILLLLKLFLRYVDIGFGLLPYHFVHVTRFQCMLIGALGAWYYFSNNKFVIRIFTSLIVQLISWLMILLVAFNSYHLASVLDQEIISGVTVAIILGQITGKNKIIDLDWRLLDFLGKISYGIYVLHPIAILVLGRTFDIELSLTIKYFAVYLLVLGLTILFAYFSYEYFEKFFLKLKTKFSAVLSSATRPEA